MRDSERWASLGDARCAEILRARKRFADLKQILWVAAVVIRCFCINAPAAQASGGDAQDQSGGTIQLAQDNPKAGGGDGKQQERPPSPEDRMSWRFPQPVKVLFLIGLPMLDEHNSSLGRIKSVQRTPEGRIKLVIGYGGFPRPSVRGDLVDRVRSARLFVSIHAPA